jgi:hypothetical protein
MICIRQLYEKRLPRYVRNDNTVPRNDNDTPCHCATFPPVIARSEATKQSHSFPSLRTNVKQSLNTRLPRYEPKAPLWGSQ